MAIQLVHSALRFGRPVASAIVVASRTACPSAWSPSGGVASRPDSVARRCQTTPPSIPAVRYLSTTRSRQRPTSTPAQKGSAGPTPSWWNGIRAFSLATLTGLATYGYASGDSNGFTDLVGSWKRPGRSSGPKYGTAGDMTKVHSQCRASTCIWC